MSSNTNRGNAESNNRLLLHTNTLWVVLQYIEYSTTILSRRNSVNFEMSFLVSSILPKNQTKTIRPEKAKTANLTTFSPILTKTIRFSLFHTLPVIFNVIYGCSHFLDDASEPVHDHFEHQ